MSLPRHLANGGSGGDFTKPGGPARMYVGASAPALPEDEDESREGVKRSGRVSPCGAARAEEIAVRWLSALLTLAILCLALAHLGSLLQAFRAKAALLRAIRGGEKLEGKRFFLWWVLFSFGETMTDEMDKDNSAPSSSTNYERDLRVWKLSGLVSAYLLALAVNVGLAVAASNNGWRRTRKRGRGGGLIGLEALFVPWIVVNLVAILALVSLAMGIAIVHLAYPAEEVADGSSNRGLEERSEETEGGYGVVWALLPLSLGLALSCLWTLVVRVYLRRVKAGRSAQGSENSSEEEEAAAATTGVASVANGTGGGGSDEEKKKLIQEGQADSRRSNSSSWSRLFPWKKSRGRGESTDEEEDDDEGGFGSAVVVPDIDSVVGGIGDRDDREDDEGVDGSGPRPGFFVVETRMVESLSSQQQPAPLVVTTTKSSSVLLGEDGRRDIPAASAASSFSSSSRSPFLPELRSDRRMREHQRQQSKRPQEGSSGLVSSCLSGDDSSLSRLEPVAPIASDFADWRKPPPATSDGVSAAAEVDGWTEFDRVKLRRPGSQEIPRRFSRRSRRQRCLSGGSAPASVQEYPASPPPEPVAAADEPPSKSVHFGVVRSVSPGRPNTSSSQRGPAKPARSAVRRSRSCHGAEEVKEVQFEALRSPLLVSDALHPCRCPSPLPSQTFERRYRSLQPRTRSSLGEQAPFTPRRPFSTLAWPLGSLGGVGGSGKEYEIK